MHAVSDATCIIYIHTLPIDHLYRHAEELDLSAVFSIFCILITYWRKGCRYLDWRLGTYHAYSSVCFKFIGPQTPIQFGFASFQLSTVNRDQINVNAFNTFTKFCESLSTLLSRLDADTHTKRKSCAISRLLESTDNENFYFTNQ